MSGRHTPLAYTPLADTPWQTYSQANTPLLLARHPPLVDTPLADPPLTFPPARHPSPGRHTPSWQTPLRPQVTATATDGTHPTGMHSCLH